MEKETFKGISITDKDRQFEKTIDGERYLFQIMNHGERAIIAGAISKSINGAPIHSIEPIEYEHIKIIITLNRVIKEGPKDWIDAEHCPSDELLYKIWGGYLDSIDDFESRLKTLVRPEALGKK